MTPRTLLTIETAAWRVSAAVVEIISAILFFGLVAVLWILTP